MLISVDNREAHSKTLSHTLWTTLYPF